MGQTVDEMANEYIREHGLAPYGTSALGGRAVCWGDLLCPQHSGRFTDIPEDVWQQIQRRAARHLGEDRGVGGVRKHWRSIVDGEVPFGLVVVDFDGKQVSASPLA